LTLRGEVAGEPWEVRMPIAAGETRPGIGKLWARRKIEQLEADAQIAGNWEQNDAEITRVALEHHLVSRRTSLVAVDVTPSRPAGEKLTSKDMPVNLPDGWDYEKVFGEQAMQRARQASFSAGGAQLVAMAAAPAAEADASTGLALPQTATDAPALIHSGMLALLLAAVLTALWWLQRHWAASAWARRRQ